MLTLKATPNFKGIDALIERFSGRRLNTAIATALTRTAKAAQLEVIRGIRSSFDRPTPYALNSTRVVPATPNKLTAYVWVKDRHGAPAAGETPYMAPQVLGGPRGRKAYETALLRAGVLRSNEFTVPAEGFPLDPYGNMPVGVLRQILSQLKAAENADGYSANRTNSVRSRRTVAKAGTFFVPRPGSGLPRGIYQRVRTGFGWGNRMVLKIVVGKPKYQPRLRLFDIAEQVVARDFQREFERAALESAARMNVGT